MAPRFWPSPENWGITRPPAWRICSPYGPSWLRAISTACWRPCIGRRLEPAEGHYEFGLVDGLIQEARRNNLKLVFLWFGSWKNGLSSYVPYWVKQDYKRFPRIQIKGGKTLELLSTFGDATRDADARAYRALMRHIKEVDGQRHTVVMMQVENEVGVLRDSRDRSAPANRAFAGPVPRELMSYLQQHKDTLIPELREVWAANGSKTSGTWEEVFGPGKPDSVDMPIQTTSPPMSREEHDTSWRNLHWPVDEIFMAWNYARFVGKVVEEGKAEYNIPMYVNAWLQQPNHAWPGSYPSGGPVPQVHDIWRAGAPAVDVLAPDLYLEYFDDVCERFTRNGNPLFIPETSANAANVMSAFGKFNAIAFSPFGIERSVGPDNGAGRRLSRHLAIGSGDCGAPRKREHHRGSHEPGRCSTERQVRRLHAEPHVYRHGPRTHRAAASHGGPDASAGSRAGGAGGGDPDCGRAG